MNYYKGMAELIVTLPDDSPLGQQAVPIFVPSKTNIKFKYMGLTVYERGIPPGGENFRMYRNPDGMWTRTLVGEKFGALTVKRCVDGEQWFCECDCGNFAAATTEYLMTGKAGGCGDVKLPRS